MKKIFIILPHKDQFLRNNSGSASIWVKDFFKLSKFKKEIEVYGSTTSLKDVSIKSIYKNILIDGAKYQSKSQIYIKKVKTFVSKHKPQIIEIHNRPSYLLNMHKDFGNVNYILIIHNDPLNLKGSTTVLERIELLKICSQIYFVSKWVEEKFFKGIEKNYYTNFKVIYPSIEPIKSLPKKQKIIIFSGKLNSAKGFDKFANAMIKILNKYKSWKALAIGDEPREKFDFSHKRFIQPGWIPHEKVLSSYNKSMITVVPSSWEEPFGRSSLEAGSRGNAVIISKRGGLPETIRSPIILEKVTSENIFKEVENLIENKQKLKDLQIDSFKNPLHLIKNNTEIIDNDRDKILNPNKKININKKSKLKILHVFNRAEKIGSRIYFISTGKKIENGLIRLGHDVEGLSDRDILSYNSGITNLKSTDILNKIFLNKAMYYRPDLILMGHVNGLNGESFEKIKKLNKNIVFSQWYEDNLSPTGPDYNKNLENLKTNFKYIDNFFISTHPDDIEYKKDSINYHFLPTPADRNIEKLNVYKNNSFTYDVFFAMSHGVNRGNIKQGKKDEREDIIKKIINSNKNIKFDIYGFNNRNPVWSESFYDAISSSCMALNINRGKSKKYSSSNRIASLMGNGLLTFIDNEKKFEDFFKKDEMIFFKNNIDLSEKLNYYKKNNNKRIKIAKKGQKKYFYLFNECNVAKYIVERSMGENIKYKPPWE